MDNVLRALLPHRRPNSGDFFLPPTLTEFDLLAVKMITISAFKLIPIELNSPKLLLPSPSYSPSCSFTSRPTPYLSLCRRRTLRLKVSCSKSPRGAELTAEEAEWLKKLPEKTKPLYAHSLPCVEAWLRSLGFHRSEENRAIWFIELPEWHAQLNLDVTDLYIRYLKTGPGNLEKDMERRFSYALSREDVENAILGGP